jgi:hypothetical protein
MKFKDWLLKSFPYLIPILALAILFVNSGAAPLEVENEKLAVLLCFVIIIYSIFYLIFNLISKKFFIPILYLIVNLCFSFIVLFEIFYNDLYREFSRGIDLFSIGFGIMIFYGLTFVFVLLRPLHLKILRSALKNKKEELKKSKYILFTILDNIFFIFIILFGIYSFSNLGSDLASGLIAGMIAFYTIVGLIIWYILNLALLRLRHNKNAFVNLSLIMIFLQLALLIPVFYSYNEHLEDKREREQMKAEYDILSIAESYKDCEAIDNFFTKKLCADKVLSNTNDIVGCVQLLSSVENVNYFKCDGVKYDSSWYSRLDEVEEYHLKIKQEQLEEEIELAKQDLFLSIESKMFIDRANELRCNRRDKHYVYIDDESERYVRPCISSCYYDLRLYSDKQVSDRERIANSYKEESCLLQKDDIQKKVDDYDQGELSIFETYAYPDKIYVIKQMELKDFFYNYKLDKCIYSIKFNEIKVDDQVRSGNFDNFNIRDSYYKIYYTIPTSSEDGFCHRLDSREVNQYQRIINEYKD